MDDDVYDQRGSRSAVSSNAILRQKSALHDKRLRTCSTDHVGRSRDSTECQRDRRSESAHLRSDSRTRPYGDYSRSRRTDRLQTTTVTIVEILMIVVAVETA